MSYHEHSDDQYAHTLQAHMPDAVRAFQELDQQAIYGTNNPIPAKYAELIALGIACTTQCPYCIETHTNAAHQTGATEQEIAQTTMIAAALRAGAAYSHGLMAMKFYEQQQAFNHQS